MDTAEPVPRMYKTSSEFRPVKEEKRTRYALMAKPARPTEKFKEPDKREVRSATSSRM
jgi:hypothetical protein